MPDVNSICRLLGLVHQAAEAASREYLFELGVGPVEARLLLLLSADNEAHAAELARSLSVPTSTVTRALRRLEAQGLLTLRRGWFRDARVLLPRLTRSGEVTRGEVDGFEAEVDRMLFGGLRADHMGVLLNALLQVVYPRTPTARSGSAQRSGENPAAATY